MKFENLFSPIEIKGLKLKNRIMFPAMGTKMVTEDGFVTEKLINYHVARAKGGNGLNMVEVSSVHRASAPKAFLSIYDDKFIPGLKKLVDGIHKAGGKAGIQLWQGGLAVAGDPQALIILPSDMPISEEHTIPGASVETIKEVVEAFGQAARRAVEAGFDCVEFHAAHGYSPHCFLSPAFNRRNDEYGGSFENRARFPLECIRAIRKNVPEDFPIFMRIVAQDDYLENGLTIEDMIEFCKLAKNAGVDVLDVSRGNMMTGALKYEVPPIDLPRGFNVENAARIRKETGMITIAVGRINRAEQAEEILAQDKADMVVMGRAQLADPEFCNKAYAGDLDNIIYCVGCNQGCFDGFVYPDFPHITCMRNPALGREGEMELNPTKTPKKVVIAGGGMAGLEAAIHLKDRGHEPILFEKSNQLGGQFLIAGMAPRKEEMQEAAISRGEQAKNKNIDIRLSTTVTKEILEELQPDTVIIATGAEPIELDIPGAKLPHVTNSHDVLIGKVEPKGNIVVIGGGLVGLEVAEYLSEKENQVTVVEMLDEVGKDLGQLRKICVMENLYALGVNTLVNAKCTEINETGIFVEIDEKTEEIKADHVIMSVGAKPTNYDEIKNYCESNSIPYYTIGDAIKARRALNAIDEAVKIANKI